MNTIKENSKSAFNQQAATYDKDIKGQHARSLYPALLEKLSHIPFSVCPGFRVWNRRNAETHFAERSP